jgi:hypothetical protein
LAFVPDEELGADINSAWQWLIPGTWAPFLCSMIGGIFLEDATGVYWLESGTGLVERVARDRAEFDEIAKSDRQKIDEWFLPPLIERLHQAGKRPGDGQCYSFITLPIFEGGLFETGNMTIVPASEVLVGLAAIHEQLSQLPDGTTLEIKVSG